MFHCGDTFLLPHPSNFIEHLWVVITEPEPPLAKAICVNIATKQSYSELTVVLSKGDHPFIKHDSVVRYGYAMAFKLKEIEQLLTMQTGRFVCELREPCSAEVLKRIQDGFLASKFTEYGIKEYYLKRCKK